MYIYIRGYEYKHDVFELARSYLKKEGIKFIKKEDFCNKDYRPLLKVNYDNKYINASLEIKGKKYEVKEELNNIDFYSFKRLYNNAMKRAVYRVLKEHYKRELDWGILTGIRPMKIYHNLLNKSLTDNEIRKILEEEYLLSKNKILTMKQIAGIQKSHLYPVDDKNYSLYVNIPFCPSKCSYCSFPSFVLDPDSELVKKYVETLIYEIRETRKILGNKNINSIYIGGGTPSFLKKIDLKKIIVTMNEEFNFRNKNIEFTVEAGRPDTIDAEKLKMLKELGVNRLSINPQTMNLKTLEKMDRRHSPESIISSYNLAKKIGFDIINMDIILGLPDEGLSDIKNTLKMISELDPDNLTVHSLAIKSGSELSFVNNKTNKNINNNREELDQLKFILEEYLSLHKLYPYYLYRQKRSFNDLENIGYAKEGKESVYNIVMMEEKQTIIGVGLGAVSKIYNSKNDSITRLPNFKGLNDYINRIDELLYSKKYKTN